MQVKWQVSVWNSGSSLGVDKLKIIAINIWINKMPLIWISVMHDPMMVNGTGCHPGKLRVQLTQVIYVPMLSFSQTNFEEQTRNDIK